MLFWTEESASPEERSGGGLAIDEGRTGSSGRRTREAEPSRQHRGRPAVGRRAAHPVRRGLDKLDHPVVTRYRGGLQPARTSTSEDYLLRATGQFVRPTYGRARGPTT